MTCIPLENMSVSIIVLKYSFFKEKKKLTSINVILIIITLEQFSNGVTVMSLYLNPVPNSKSSPIEHSIHQVIKEASLIYCLPTTPFQNFFQSGKLSVQEAIYGYVGWIFAQHFLNRLGN